ncbi:MAG: DinB family protein [Chloroflexi bacterium]|nr:DinB family protein [Chloroflexota bacterium]
MTRSELLIDLFNVNAWVLKKQTDGLTHEDSLLQLPFRGNCLNWVLGHIVAGRNSILGLLGDSPIWGEEEQAPYRRGSEPITCDKNVHSLEELLNDFHRSQTLLVAALEHIPQEKLEKIIETFRGEKSLGDHVAFLQWHEAYHIGQLELLRQLAGKDDAVV